MAGKLQGLSRQQRKDLWEIPGVEGWYSFLRDIAPKGGWVRTANSVKGRCVVAQKKGKRHQDSNPSMELVPSKGLVWCFPCGVGEGDPLEFVRLVRPDMDKSDAYYQLMQRFNLPPSPEVEERLRFETQFNNLKLELVEAFHQVAAQAIVDSSMEYAQEAVRFLRRRGLQVGNLFHYKIGIFPTRRDLWTRVDKEYVNLIDEYLPGAFSSSASPDDKGRYGGRIVFPYFHSPRRVARFKLRDPEPDPAKRAEPMWIGNEPATEQGFFGLHMYDTIIGNDDNEAARRVYLVEGEFDQLSLEQSQWTHDNGKEWPIVAGSGGAVADVERLADVGFQEVCVIGDNDAGGDQFIKNILRGISGRRLRKVRLFRWPNKYAGIKDPDEVVVGGRYAELRADMLDMANFEEAPAWATRMALEEANNATERPTIKERVEFAKEYGQLISDPVEFDVYVEAVSKALDLKTSLIEKHAADISTGPNFVEAIIRALRRVFKPLTLHPNLKLSCFDAKRQRVFHIPMSPVRTMSIMIQNEVLNTGIFKWVSTNVGIPPFIAQDTSKRGAFPRDYTKQVDMVMRHFDEAVQEYAAEAAPDDATTMLGQGIHWVDEDNSYAGMDLDTGQEPRRTFVVNGAKVFVGLRDPLTGINVAEELTTPMHGAFVFDLERHRQWSSNALTADDLNSVPPLSKLETLEGAMKLVGEWGLSSPENDVPHIAAFAMGANVMTLFPSMAFLYLTATTTSGKTTMLLGLLCAKKYPKITIVENSVGHDNWSAAGVLQSAAGTSHLTCVDEFEDPDVSDRSAEQLKETRKLLSQIRNMEAGMKRSRGTRWQRAIEQEIKVPFAAAGVHPFQQAVDINRWTVSTFDKVEGKTAPDIAIVDKYGADYIQALRRSITLHAFQNMYRWREIYDDLLPRVMRKEFFQYRSTRTARMIIPQLTIMEDAGWAGRWEWASSYVAYMEEAHIDRTSTEEDKLFRAVFHTNGVRLEHLRNPQSVIKILAQPECRGDLSRADVGVYWMDGADAVILWPEKLPALLKYHPSYRNSSNVNQMYQLLKRHPLVHSDARFFVENQSVLRFLRQFARAPDPRELLYVKMSDIHFTRGDQSDPPNDM